MKTFKQWLEVSKPAAATAGWLLGGIPGAVLGYHLGQDEKKPVNSQKPAKTSSGWASQNMVHLSPEELLQNGVVEGQIVRDIYDKSGRSVETVLPNGVRITKFIGHLNTPPRGLAKLSPEELMQQGVIEGTLIKDDIRDISPGVKERWITTKSNSGIETTKYIGNL